MAVDPTKDRPDAAEPQHRDRPSRQILENLGDVVWVTSSDDARLVYVNPAYESVWGRTARSLRADPLSWMESVHPHDLDAVRRFIAAKRPAPRGGGDLPAFRIIREDGAVRWIQARLIPIDAGRSGGRQKGFIARDVTRRRSLETALRESEEKWRSLLENAPDHVLLVDLDGHVLFANRRFFGQSRADLTGKHLLHLMPSRFTGAVRSCLGRVVSMTEAASCRIERDDPGGGKVFYELRMSPVQVDGLTVAVAVSAMDITDRIAQERILKESEAFHRALFEESPTGLSIQDFSAVEAPLKRLTAAGIEDLRAYLTATPGEVERLARLVRLVRVNQATIDLYHAPDAAHMIGPLYRVFEPEDHSHFIDQVVAFTSGEDRYEGEARNRDFDGNTLHLILRKVVIDRSKNGISMILAALIDVTPIRAAEKERAALMLQLQQAQKMEAIGTLAGGVAHDFNNILSIILGNAELSKVDIGPGHPVHRNVKEIITACLRARQIVQQLLGFSRRSKQNLEPMHLTPLVSEAVNFMRATIPANISLHAGLSAVEDVIRADATQIHQIMINLLTNAAHVLEDGGGSISVHVDNAVLERPLSDAVLAVPAGRYVRIMVRDTGRGISQKVRERIFEPYFTTKSVGKGTGMGLAVVHGIIKNYGGGIVLDSQAGTGTTFTLYFPLAQETAAATSSTDQSVPTGSERILFVDDEAMIVEIAETMLTRLGYRVRSCIDPAAALALLADGKADIDLLITDMAMPKMTGDQLIARVRRTHPDLPVILCTGYGDRIPEGRLAAMGVAEMLTKPVERNTLALAVRRVLDQKQGRG